MSPEPENPESSPGDSPILLMKSQEAFIQHYFETCFLKRKFEDLPNFLEPEYCAYKCDPNAHDPDDPTKYDIANEDNVIRNGPTLVSLLEKITAGFEEDEGLESATFYPLTDKEIARAGSSPAWIQKVTTPGYDMTKLIDGALPLMDQKYSVGEYLCKCKIVTKKGREFPKLWLFSPGNGKLLAAWPVVF